VNTSGNNRTEIDMADVNVERDTGLETKHAERDGDLRTFNNCSDQTNATVDVSRNIVRDVSVNVSQNNDDVVAEYIDIQEDSSQVFNLRNTDEGHIVSGMFDYHVQTNASLNMSGTDAVVDMPENTSTDTSVNVPLIKEIDETDVDITGQAERHAVSGISCYNDQANVSLYISGNTAIDASSDMVQNVENDTQDVDVVTTLAQGAVDSGYFNHTEETVAATDGLQNSGPPDTANVVDTEQSAGHVTQTGADVGGIIGSACPLEGVTDCEDFDPEYNGMTDVCEELIAESIGLQTPTGKIPCKCSQLVNRLNIFE